MLQCSKNPFPTYLEFDRYTTPRLDWEGSEKKRRTFPMCQLNTNFEVILTSNSVLKIKVRQKLTFQKLAQLIELKLFDVAQFFINSYFSVKSIDPSVESGMEPVFTSTKWNAYIWRDSHN